MSIVTHTQLAERLYKTVVLIKLSSVAPVITNLVEDLIKSHFSSQAAVFGGFDFYTKIDLAQMTDLVRNILYDCQESITSLESRSLTIVYSHDVVIFPTTQAQAGLELLKTLEEIERKCKRTKTLYPGYESLKDLAHLLLITA